MKLIKVKEYELVKSTKYYVNGTLIEATLVYDSKPKKRKVTRNVRTAVLDWLLR